MCVCAQVEQVGTIVWLRCYSNAELTKRSALSSLRIDPSSMLTTSTHSWSTFNSHPEIFCLLFIHHSYFAMLSHCFISAFGFYSEFSVFEASFRDCLRMLSVHFVPVDINCLIVCLEYFSFRKRKSIDFHKIWTKLLGFFFRSAFRYSPFKQKYIS